jgi:hypothetical protein
MTLRSLLSIVALTWGLFQSVFAGTVIPPLSDVAALARAGTSDGDTVVVAGYAVAGDGGGGTFMLNTASTATPDSGTVFARTAGGRWLRVTSTIDVRMFGAKGDGVTNDRAAIQAAIDAAVAQGFTAVHFGGKRYKVSGSRYDSAAGRYFEETTLEASLTEGTYTSQPYYRGILKIGFHARRPVSAVSATTDKLTIPTHGFNSGEAVVISSTGTIPNVAGSALHPGLFYYVGIIDANSIVLYRDSGLTQVVDFADAGSGTFGVEGTSGPRITLSLLGEGSTLYTDDESGSATVTNYGQNGSNDGTTAPSIFLVKTNFSSLTIKDLTLERGITGGRITVPGNYQSQGGSTAPGALSGSEKSFLDLPGGWNRGGIVLIPSSPDPVDSVTFDNLVFIDCHTALSTSNVPAGNLRDYYGKLTTLNLEGCRFICPFGSNSAVGDSSNSGGVGTVLSQWVGTARVTNCDFDGAAGSVADNVRKIPSDGFIFGDPDRLICTNNRVRHCGVEYLYHFTKCYLAYLGDTWKTITMPSGSDTITLELDYPNSMPPWVMPGQRVYVGFGQPDAPGNRRSAGFMRIEAIENSASGGTRSKLTLSNTGSPVNPAAGESVALQSCWISIPEFAARSSSIIANNEIDCSSILGLGVPAQNSNHGGPAIRVDDVSATITGNKILNAVSGIMLSETLASEGRMWGSVVSNNTIQLADTQKVVTRIDTGTDRLTIPDHAWNDAEWLTISSNETLPTVNGTALVAGAKYYGKKIDDSTVQLYRDEALTQLIDFTNQGSGTISVANFYGPSGTSCLARGTKIESNSILMQNANHCSGIGIAADFCSVLNNTITGIARDPNGLPGYGITLINGLTFCNIDGNMTRNTQIAIAPAGEDTVYSVEQHYSSDDGQGPIVNEHATYRDQEIQFLPPAEGWYRIVKQPYSPFAGELTITSPKTVNQTELAGYMEAVVRMDHVTNSSRHLVQEVFNGDFSNLPMIDQMLLSGGGGAEVLVHATRPAIVPIIFRFKTEMPGSYILSKPEGQEQGPAFADRNITNITTSGSPNPTSATITTQLPHGLTVGETIYLLDTPPSLRLNGTYVVASIVDSTRFTLTMPPGAQPTTTATGSYFKSDSGSTYPDGLDKFLTFSSTNSIQLSGGGIGLSGGQVQASAINFGVNGDGNTGIFQDNVSSVGIAINGSLVARFDSNGFDVNGIAVSSGTNNQPGYGFDGDDGTGIYHPAGKTIAFATDGVERMRIENSGVTVSGAATVTGNLTIGGGMTIKKIIRLSKSVTVGVVNSLDSNVVDVTDAALSGVAVGDTVILNFDPNSATSNRVFYTAWVPTGGGKVSIRATNPSASNTGSLTPGLYITVISFGP